MTHNLLKEPLEGFAVHIAEELNTRDELFERLSKNIKSWNAQLTYVEGNLTSITFTEDAKQVVKTLTYDQNGLLVGITLSGYSLDNDITKTLIYDSEQVLTGYNYQ